MPVRITRNTDSLSGYDAVVDVMVHKITIKY